MRTGRSLRQARVVLRVGGKGRAKSEGGERQWSMAVWLWNEKWQLHNEQGWTLNL